MSKKVTVSVGLRDVEVEVGDNDTGYEIKRAVYLSGKGFPGRNTFVATSRTKCQRLKFYYWE